MTRDDDFELFVRASRGALVRFATTLTGGDGHLAEDLVQNALVRVYLVSSGRITDLHGYVRRAIVNGLVDHTRRPFFRRERVLRDLPDRPDTVVADRVDPTLLAALAGLPVRMRAAVVLRHVEGLSVEEAAAALGCSTGTVKSQTARGLDKLRQELDRAESRTGAAVHLSSTARSTRTPGAREGEH